MTADPEPLGLRTLLPTLTAQLPHLIDQVVDLLRDEWPDYAQFVAEDPEDSTRIAELALLRLVNIAERTPEQRALSPLPEDALEHEAFEEIGRLEWREGRSLGTLLSAYRAGARVAWGHISSIGVQQGLPPADIASLAEAVFIFVEELSSSSAHGYVDEQRTTSVERERLRAQLSEILLSDRADSSLVRSVAMRAGWMVPTTAALVLIDPTKEAAHTALSRLDPSCLPLRQGGLTGAILPDPDAPGRRALIERTLQGCGAVVGSSVPLAQLPSSVRVAEAAAQLAQAGILHQDPVFVADHYDTILVVRDPWLLAQIRASALAPLDSLPESARNRLEETLAAWLTALGDRQAAALALHVHPQTVRYRLRQLRELFGSALDDPVNRRRLMLAVCWSQPTS
jgi:hypothetical protein